MCLHICHCFLYMTVTKFPAHHILGHDNATSPCPSDVFQQSRQQNFDLPSPNEERSPEVELTWCRVTDTVRGQRPGDILSSRCARWRSLGICRLRNCASLETLNQRDRFRCRSRLGNTIGFRHIDIPPLRPLLGHTFTNSHAL